MARGKKAKEKPKADEAVVITDDAGVVDVRWHDGNKLTFNLIVKGRTIKFVDGVATVDAALADELRKRGVVM